MEEIDKLIDKIESETFIAYYHNEVIEMLYDLQYKLQKHYE